MILILTKLTGIINLVRMSSQSRETKRKGFEESTQSTFEAFSLAKEDRGGSGTSTYCESLLDQIEGLMIIEDSGVIGMNEGKNVKKISEFGAKSYNIWETPEKSQGQWCADG